MFNVVGKKIPNIDSWEKAVGRAQYTIDKKLPNMLIGKVFRSSIANARIKHININQALKVPGVKCILTGKDCPGNKYGPIINDQYILPVDNRVRFVGDEIAAVAAINEEAADEAISLIEIEYEELPAVLNIEEALKPGAPIVNNNGNGNGNIAYQLEINRGDMNKGWKKADYIVEGTYTTPIVHQCYIEPVTCLAQLTSDNRLEIWIPGQTPFKERERFSQILGIPESRIRIRETHIGGSFGGKIRHKSYLICGLLALKSGYPVRMQDTREEAFQIAYSRVGMKIYGRLGVSKEGRFVAKEMRIMADNGAYCDRASVILEAAALTIDNLYCFKNIHTEAKLIYTNKVPSGSFRGFGNPQTTFCFESLVDEAARTMGWDPAKLRLKNTISPNSTSIHGWRISSCALDECIQKATEASKWTEKQGRENSDSNIKKGIGMACCIHKSGTKRHPFYEGSSAIVRIDRTGSVTVLCGEVDIGQGARTIWAQIAAEVIGIPLEKVHVAPLDTDYSPYGLGTFASNVTTLGGKAVKLAAENAYKQLVGVAAKLLEVKSDRVELNSEKFIIKNKPESSINFVDVARRAEELEAGLPIIGKGICLSPNVVYPDESHYGNPSTTYSFATHIAEVEVNICTGQVQVTRFIAVHDSGRIINRLTAEGQVEGGIVQGMGYALYEQLLFDEKGKLLNPSFLDYKIPTFSDIPEIETIFVETEDPYGPFGAKGLGEPAIVPVAPAIANAIANALDCRIRDLPITPTKIWEVMSNKARQGGSIKDA